MVTYLNFANFLKSAVGEVMHPTTITNEAVKGDKHEAITVVVPHCLHRVKLNTLSSEDAQAVGLARKSSRLEHVSASREVNKTRRVLRKTN